MHNNYLKERTLCFNETEFTKDTFSIDDFLREHNKSSLEILRDDLGSYLKLLRLSMIELINKDYEDFVNLSTDLIGLEKAINNIETPLGKLKEEVLGVKFSLEETMSGLQTCLDEHNKIRDRKRSLQHLTQVYRSLSNLRHIGLEKESSQQIINLDLIERAAVEFGQLQFSMSKCSKDIPNIYKQQSQEIGMKIIEVLNNMFLEYLCEKHLEELSRCLRIYASLDEIKTLEELMSNAVIAPVIQQIIDQKKSIIQRDSTGLKQVYRDVLLFIDTQLKDVLFLTMHKESNQITKGFNIIVNSLWPTLEKQLELCPDSLFAFGNPELFHARYMDTLDFLRELEIRCGSKISVLELRKHPLYNQFIQKWNLPVYFKIRFRQIAGSLELGLNEENILLTMNGGVEQCGFHLKSSICALNCLKKCWQEDIFIPQLAHSFWKLCLQILARYKKWMQEVQEKMSAALSQSNKASESAENSVNKEEKFNQILHFNMCLYIDTIILIKTVIPVLRTAEEIISSQQEIREKLDKTLKLSIDEIESHLPKVRDSIVKSIVSESCVHLKQINEIPRKFRRTNREKPTESSDYVSSVFVLPKTFYEAKKSFVPLDVLVSLLHFVFTEVTEQFYVTVNDVLINVQKTEESLRKIKKSRDRSSNIKETKTGVSDDQKMRYQILLDVKKYENDIQIFNLPKIEKIKDLIVLVEKAITVAEGQ